MARIPEYPPILSGRTEAQIAQIREFLMRLVRDLADAGVYGEHSGGDSGTDDYDELLNKPKINGTELIGNRTTAQIGAAAAVHTHTTEDITDFPELATVATSGSYNDLTDRPVNPPSVTTANSLNRLIYSVQQISNVINTNFTHENTLYHLAFSVSPESSGYVSMPVLLGSPGVDYTVTAYPADGYRFKGWYEGGQQKSTNATELWTANANRNIMAVFEEE